MFAYCGNNPVSRADASGHAFYNCFDSYEHLLKNPFMLPMSGGGTGKGGKTVSKGSEQELASVLIAISFGIAFMGITIWAFGVTTVAELLLVADVANRTVNYAELEVLQYRKAIQCGYSSQKRANSMVQVISDNFAVRVHNDVRDYHMHDYPVEYYLKFDPSAKRLRPAKTIADGAYTLYSLAYDTTALCLAFNVEGIDYYAEYRGYKLR